MSDDLKFPNVPQGRSKLATEEDIVKALSEPDRECAGKTVEPYGLYLNRVFYDKDVLMKEALNESTR